MSTSTAEWQMRSRTFPNGVTRRWLERPHPDGGVSRTYLDSEFRDGPIITPSFDAEAVVTPGAVSDAPSVLITTKCFSRIWDLGLSGKRESAGALYGRPGTLTVREVVRAVKDSTYGSCVIDTNAIDRASEKFADDGLVLIGSWHSEPGAGPEDPSPNDLEHWRSWTAAHGSPYYVGVTIRRPHEHWLGWKGSHVFARVFQKTASGVVGPSNVKEIPYIEYIL